MITPVVTRREEIPIDWEGGYLDHQIHTHIRERIARDGYDDTREFVAMCLASFNDRPRRNGGSQ